MSKQAPSNAYATNQSQCVNQDDRRPNQNPSKTNENLKQQTGKEKEDKQDEVKSFAQSDYSVTIETKKLKNKMPVSKSNAHPTERCHFRIDWRQLSYYKKPRASFKARGSHEPARLQEPTSGTEPKCILNSLDGCFKSGQLSAILGPSGAGKSTFLSALFGSKQQEAFGETKVTWLSGSADPEEQMRLNLRNKRRPIRMASLPQHDHLLHHLSVYESLMFASKIKNATKNIEIPRDKDFHYKNVKRIARMLKLTDCLGTRCGKLSGGQYKRVSIAQELLSEPDVIILDEPTSGLDAMTCLTTVKTLKSIVMRQPISIILTIHQPDMDVFSLFDHVYVIAQGGRAIYEGPPGGIAQTLAQVDLEPPTANYNPARLIVENAFVVEAGGDFQESPKIGGRSQAAHKSTDTAGDPSDDDDDNDNDDDDDDDDDDSEDEFLRKNSAATRSNFLKSSLLSLGGSLSGSLANLANTNPAKQAARDKRPLLNIGVQTLDGKLITSKQLAMSQSESQRIKRLDLISRLNEMQKARYYSELSVAGNGLSSPSPDGANQRGDSPAESTFSRSPDIEKFSLTKCSGYSSSADWSDDKKVTLAPSGSSRKCSPRGTLSKAASLCQMGPQTRGASQLLVGSPDDQGDTSRFQTPLAMSIQSLNKQDSQQQVRHHPAGGSPSLAAISISGNDDVTQCASSKCNYHENCSTTRMTSVLTGNVSANPSPTLFSQESSRFSCLKVGTPKKMRDFDKRLSAKRNCSRRNDYPTWYHTVLIMHRTWLSIIRDPIFFGIQAVLHTTIPALLAAIFGHIQEEGCPRLGSVDLVDFAYSDSDSLIRDSMTAVRQSISNIGIIFFEMFVLSFSINCITALVFPMDMHVLVKEYRNGWYSLKSYFLGRTIADSPVPIVLHTIGMSILYFATGQPWSAWRFGSIMLLVILASLISQSVGLAVGAILMKSSQSAVLVAAGLVAPFFALSGFIVRIYTLPFFAQWAAKFSYLYHLLNGFIILRYGFGRCPCNEEDFEPNPSHQIPQNLRTLASIWIGTYSEEYASNAAISHLGNPQQIVHMPHQLNTTLMGNNQLNSTTLGIQATRTNVDPNIDVVEKIMNTVKLANSYGHQIETCNEVLPYAMLDFNLIDNDVYMSLVILIVMLFVSRLMTFSAIYYKIQSFA